jgi:hypothetical protein
VQDIAIFSHYVTVGAVRVEAYDADTPSGLLGKVCRQIVPHMFDSMEYPIRQGGMSADVGKTLEGIQSQLLKMQQAN